MRITLYLSVSNSGYLPGKNFPLAINYCVHVIRIKLTLRRNIKFSDFSLTVKGVLMTLSQIIPVKKKQFTYRLIPEPDYLSLSKGFIYKVLINDLTVLPKRFLRDSFTNSFN